MAKFYSQGTEIIDDIIEDEFSDEGLSFKVTHDELEISKLTFTLVTKSFFVHRSRIFPHGGSHRHHGWLESQTQKCF